MVTATKVEAAIRQLDTAITLTFAEGDPLPIRTLAAAALGILGDLVDARNPHSSWRARIIQDAGVSQNAVIEIMNHAQNFLKHADRDASAMLDFDEAENDDVLFVAVLECGELGEKSSLLMQAFQIWYLAAHPDRVGHDTAPVKTARRVLPGLETLPRREQLARGAAFVGQVRNHAPAASNA